MNKEDFKILAQQLSCPEGEEGIKTGEIMNITNSNMILSTIEKLSPENNEKILEIGPGNASHLSEILNRSENIIYTGLDISETMISEAKRINNTFILNAQASFQVSDGKVLDPDNDYFDKAFTVNTVYFWDEPLEYAKEIFRVLKPGGTFCLTFAEKKFMETLPFTVYGFQLYSIADAEKLLIEAGFELSHTEIRKENVKSNAGDTVEREFIIMTVIKAF